MRMPRWWVRNVFTRSATRRPARAKTSSGRAAPIANETVSTTVSTPMRPVEPATVIAASTGPAQGTYTAPSARPSGNPPRSVPTFRCGIHENGFSSSCSKRGTMSPTPISTSTTMPAQRSTSCGRPSRPRMSEPTSVNRLKLTTSPAITRYGRQRPACGASVVPLALCAPPDRKMTGSTGRMHGEMPVMRPPRRPMRARVITGPAFSGRRVIRSRRPIRLVGCPVVRPHARVPDGFRRSTSRIPIRTAHGAEPLASARPEAGIN